MSAPVMRFQRDPSEFHRGLVIGLAFGAILIVVLQHLATVFG